MLLTNSNVDNLEVDCRCMRKYCLDNTDLDMFILCRIRVSLNFQLDIIRLRIVGCHFAFSYLRERTFYVCKVNKMSKKC